MGAGDRPLGAAFRYDDVRKELRDRSPWGGRPGARDHAGPMRGPGIDLSDYERLSEKVATWDDWWDQWTAMGEHYLGLADRFEAAGWPTSAGAARVRAGIAFHFGKALAVQDDARYRDLTIRSVEAVAAGLRLMDPTFERIEVPFDGHHVVGNLRRPRGADRAPLVLLIPGTESVKEEFPQWEEEFLSRGMATSPSTARARVRSGSSWGSGTTTTKRCPRCSTPWPAATTSTSRGSAPRRQPRWLLRPPLRGVRPAHHGGAGQLRPVEPRRRVVRLIPALPREVHLESRRRQRGDGPRAGAGHHSRRCGRAGPGAGPGDLRRGGRADGRRPARTADRRGAGPGRALDVRAGQPRRHQLRRRAPRPRRGLARTHI